MPESHPASRTLAVLCLFGALAVMHTWPLAYAPSRQIHAAEDVLPGMWSLTEMAHRLVTDPAHLMDGNIFYPFRNTLAILDHQFSNALVAAPLAVAGADGVYVYNVVLLATFVLSGFFTYLLVRRLTGSTGAGLVAGCLFAFSGYRALHMTQAHLLATQWLPLSLLMLHRYVERPTWPRWAGFAGATLLLALSSWHVAIIGAIGVGLVAVWLLAGDLARARRPVTGLVLVAVLCGLALLPLARAYMQIGAQWPPLTGAGRETVGNIVNMSANLAGLIAPAATSHAPYKPWLSPFDQSHPGVFPGVMAIVLALPALALLKRAKAPPSAALRLLQGLLIGATALVVVGVGAALVGPRGQPLVALLRPLAPFVLFGLALAAMGLMAARRAGPVDGEARQVLAYAVVAVAGALLALGPRVLVGPVDVGSGLWRFDLLPVRLVIRAPERLSLLLALGTAVLAGFGVARLLKGRAAVTSAAVVAGLLVLVNADLRFTNPALQPAPGLRQADRWLAQEPEAGAVIDYPLHWTNMWTMYASQRYGRRIVNGTGYLIPWQYKSLEDEPDLSPDQMAVLWEHFHPRFAIVRTDLYEPEERARVLGDIDAEPGALRERARFGSDRIFEIVDQGHGAELFRRWPYGELAGKGELALEARVTDGRPGTVGGLIVSLNDRTLLEASDAEGPDYTAYQVPFTPDLLDGMNAFQLSATYLFAETADAHAIGTTGVRLAADVAVTSDRERAVVVVNGRVFRPGRGYFLVALDPASGRILRTGAFDVSSSAAEAAALTAFIDETPAGAVVVLATEFDASRALTAEAAAALAGLGLEVDLRGQFQVMHAAIGVKGAAPGTAIEGTDRLHVSLSVGEMDRREVQLRSLVLR
jgi:hypothetical protein